MLATRPLPADGFEQQLQITDPDLGLEGCLAIHRSAAGRAFGGIRVRAYPDRAALEADARRLARAMSAKLAFAGLPGGGAKLVLRDHPGLDRPAAMTAIGALIESFEGRYYGGPDFGLRAEDLDRISGQTRYVATACLAGAAATGVVAAIRGALDVLGLPLAGARILVQGAGAVGAPVVVALREAGATVRVADIDPARGDLPLAELFDWPCDVFSPCAVGDVLGAAEIARLSARAVVGAANDPLRDPAGDSQRLHERGILYIPDYVANAGATIQGALGVLERPAEAPARIAAIRAAVVELVAAARQHDTTPWRVAEARVERQLEESSHA